MLSFHAHLKVFVATAPCDLRAHFDGLWTAAQQQLGENPKSGALFVFGNRRRNRIKILYFDGTGTCVFASAPLTQGRAFGRLPDFVRECLRGPRSDAQLCLQFARSSPGVTSAIVGMREAGHIEQNLALARLPVASPEAIEALFKRAAQDR